jgi:hypothetical protein
MFKTLSIIAVSVLGTATASAATMPSMNIQTSQTPPIEIATNSSSQPISVNEEFSIKDSQDTTPQEVVPEKPIEKRLVCKGCNENENITLSFLQDNGVKDKNALATIMGNIRQESSFFPNICEGGARVSYRGCRRGGYGAIQWTDAKRYYGLGMFASKMGGDPSSLGTQLEYLLYEDDWKMIEPHMKRPGGSIHDYMRLARKWIRWGHHGARTHYAYDYSKRLIFTESES